MTHQILVVAMALPSVVPRSYQVLRQSISVARFFSWRNKSDKSGEIGKNEFSKPKNDPCKEESGEKSAEDGKSAGKGTANDSGEKGAKGSGEKGAKGSGEKGAKGSGEKGAKGSGEKGAKGSGEKGAKGSGEKGAKGSGEKDACQELEKSGGGSKAGGAKAKQGGGGDKASKQQGGDKATTKQQEGGGDKKEAGGGSQKKSIADICGDKKDSGPKVGINGFDRLGQIIAKLSLDKNIQIGAINEPNFQPDMIATLFKHNTNVDATVTEDSITINGKKISLFRESQPDKIPWKKDNIEYIVETSGRVKTKDQASALMSCGGKKVFVAGYLEDAPMYVHMFNCKTYKPDEKVLSMGTPGVYSIAPITRLLEECLTIVDGAFVSMGKCIDAPTRRGELRLAKNEGLNLTSTETKVAERLEKIFPSLSGKLKSSGLQVPAGNCVMMNDLTFRFSKEVSLKEIKCLVFRAAEGPFKGVLGYVDDEVTANDFVKTTLSSILDASASLAISKNTFKLVTWSDNTCGFANGVVEFLKMAMGKDKEQKEGGCGGDKKEQKDGKNKKEQKECGGKNSDKEKGSKS